MLNNKAKTGSLTIEAALVLPIYTYLIVALLYFIQLFIIQEHIQNCITNTGLTLARTAYVYEDIASILTDFGHSKFESALDAGIPEINHIADELNIDMNDMLHSYIDGAIVKAIVGSQLDIERINSSCIQEGFQGVSFYYTKVLDDENCIDIIVSYRIRIPLPILGLSDMGARQRIRVRAWNGHKVTATYVENQNAEEEEIIVYITETGRVYHRSDQCSHIKLSTKQVSMISPGLRNVNGGRYYPCEICCKNKGNTEGEFYITDYGVRYHQNKNCSRIKRTVQKISISKVEERKPCKRCAN